MEKTVVWAEARSRKGKERDEKRKEKDAFNKTALALFFLGCRRNASS